MQEKHLKILMSRDENFDETFYISFSLLNKSLISEDDLGLEDVWKVFWWSTGKTRVWARLGKNRKKQS